MQLPRAIALSLALAVPLALADVAAAQGKRPPADPPTDAPADAAPAEPLPSTDERGDPAGASENPVAPETPWDAKPEVEAVKAAPAAPEPYPLERVRRPLVLPRRTLEIGLDAPMTTAEPERIGATVRAAFGVTNEAQVGLRYHLGTAASGESFGGKAFALDVRYAVFRWLAPQISLPVHLGPYAQGLVLAAPMKFTFLGKLAIEVGNDLVGIKLSRFLPSTRDQAENAALEQLEATSGLVPDGELNLGGRATWQFDPKLAGDLRYNIRMIDFESSGAPNELTVGVAYSTSSRIDFSARTGFLDLDEAESFAFELGAALRL
jgi:hypothetical protein